MTEQRVTFPDISGLLAPHSVAVIGASDRPGNLGGDTVHRLVRFGFPGPVFPVNRSREPVAGRTAFATVAELPQAAGLAIFAIPAAGIPAAVRECAAAGIRHGVAYAGGFAEAGPEGAALQRELTEACRETGFLLCGPNCVGIINSDLPVTSTFATALHEVDALKPGVVSMVTQSGGIGTTLFSMAMEAGFGFRHLVSGGNEAVLGFADYLHAFAVDEGTRVIAGYLEGVTDGPRFIAAVAEARRRGKPVVLIKSGSTPDAARAALAHTGSLAGEDRVFDAVLREFGVIRVWSLEELLDVCLYLAGLRPGLMPRGPGIGIVSFGGGHGVLATDQAVREGLAIPTMDAEATRRLRAQLLSVASAANPMDLTPSTAFRPEAFARLPAALDVMANAPGIEQLLFIVSALGSKAQEIGDLAIALQRSAAKPVAVSWSAPPRGVVARLAEAGIYNFIDFARAVRAMARIAPPPQQPGPAETPPLVLDWPALLPGGATPGMVVTEDRCHALLRAAGLPVADGRLVRDAVAAAEAAGAIGLPVALKAISPQVTHRAAAGLLAVGLASAAAVQAAAAHLLERAAARQVELDGLLVQRMERGSAELILAAFRDPVFGPMVSAGAGGGLAELIDDVVIARAPLDAAGAAALIRRLRVARHAREDGAPLDVAPVAAYLAELSRLAAAAPWRRFVLEVNPVKWSATRAVAVDGLLIIDEP